MINSLKLTLLQLGTQFFSNLFSMKYFEGNALIEQQKLYLNK